MFFEFDINFSYLNPQSLTLIKVFCKNYFMASTYIYKNVRVYLFLNKSFFVMALGRTFLKLPDCFVTSEKYVTWTELLRTKLVWILCVWERQSQCWEETCYKRNEFLEQVSFWKTEVGKTSFKNKRMREINKFFLRNVYENYSSLKILKIYFSFFFFIIKLY